MWTLHFIAGSQHLLTDRIPYTHIYRGRAIQVTVIHPQAPTTYYEKRWCRIEWEWGRVLFKGTARYCGPGCCGCVALSHLCWRRLDQCRSLDNSTHAWVMRRGTAWCWWRDKLSRAMTLLPEWSSVNWIKEQEKGTVASHGTIPNFPRRMWRRKLLGEEFPNNRWWPNTVRNLTSLRQWYAAGCRRSCSCTDRPWLARCPSSLLGTARPVEATRHVHVTTAAGKTLGNVQQLQLGGAAKGAYYPLYLRANSWKIYKVVDS